MSKALMLPFLEIEPAGEVLPVVASVPHSGTFVPGWLSPKFEPQQLEALWNSDWFLPELYDFLPQLGVRLLIGTHSRYVGDLNRAEVPAWGDFWRSMVPAKTAAGRVVYRELPSEAELLRMRDEHHRPYHERLTAILAELRQRFGEAYLLDLHSFYGLIEDDVCLGNAHGVTCAEPVLAAFEAGFRQQGFQTVRNRVFAGGYITRHYGVQAGVQALQVELRYTCYHDCSHIDEPLRPVPDPARIGAARVRLRQAFEHALKVVHPRS